MGFGLLQPDESYLADPDITNSFRQHQSIQASLIHPDIRDNTQQLQDETGKQGKLSKWPQLCLSKLFPPQSSFPRFVISFPSPLSGKFLNSVVFWSFSSSLNQYCQNFVYQFSQGTKIFFLFDLCFLCHYYVFVFIICFLLFILKFCTFKKEVNQNHISLQSLYFTRVTCDG